VKPIALTIAGSDPCGGAGIQADLKTFHQFGVYGEAVITLITVQNTQHVAHVEPLLPQLVIDQIDAVLDDIPPHAAKLGALGTREIVEAVALAAGQFQFPLVIDPVMISKHGAPLMTREAREAVRDMLVPRATLLTPNLAEASLLAGIEISGLDDMREAAKRLHDMGAEAVLVKGGHLAGVATDILYFDGKFLEFSADRIDTRHTHGTGCTYSAAITACLAIGEALPDAVRRAKAFITAAILTNPGFGEGAGPLNHHAAVPVRSTVLSNDTP
jgi:hydroxymethylpyrimidine/phosphomethylpyrimidine kinase